MSVQDDKMRFALDQLLSAQQKILSAISELRKQDYTAEATNLDTVLTSLKTRTTEAIQAVNLP
jgi:uncharacterized protein with HEPN domain